MIQATMQQKVSKMLQDGEGSLTLQLRLFLKI